MTSIDELTAEVARLTDALEVQARYYKACVHERDAAQAESAKLRGELAEPREDVDVWMRSYDNLMADRDRLRAELAASRTRDAQPTAAGSPRDACANCGCLRSGHHAAGCEGGGGECGCPGFAEPGTAVPPEKKARCLFRVGGYGAEFPHCVQRAFDAGCDLMLAAPGEGQ